MKIDLIDDKKVEFSEAMEMAGKWPGIKNIEISCKLDININEVLLKQCYDIYENSLEVERLMSKNVKLNN